MARKPRKGPGGGQPRQEKPQGSGGGGTGAGGGGFGPLRDSIRRDVEQAVTALAFSERLHFRLDTQRRLFHDFPRSIEQIRSGAMERLTAALARLYEGGQGFDLQRFLRDLPLATAQLAAADRKSQPPFTPAVVVKRPGEGATSEAPPAAAGDENAVPVLAAAEDPASATPTEPPPAAPAEPASEPPSPRLELRAKMLTAAPNLAKAAQSYRRNVATLRRAALPRRSQGPWRTDREVLEEARRAVEFVQKLYDTYAEAWADQRLPADLYEQSAAETDRFLGWTQLDRYAELALLASTGQPRVAKPGQQIVGGARQRHPPETAHGAEAALVAEAAAHAEPPVDSPATLASEGAGGETEPETETSAERPEESPEPGRA